jgi:hypothetical protein
MRKQLLPPLLIALFAITLGIMPYVGVQRVAAQGTTRETQPVYTTPDGFLLGPPVSGAYSDLLRSNNGLTTNVHTFVTAAGVESVWWVIFNHPASCVTYLCTFDEPDLVVSATAHVIPASGIANLSGSLRVGGPYSGEVIYEGPEPSLTNPTGALITLVIRYHGPKLPGSEQMSTYLGGCPDGGAPCVDAQLVIFPGNECTGACADPLALP